MPYPLPFPLEPGEEVILRVQRHWIAFWPPFAALLVAGALPGGFTLGLLVRNGVAAPILWRLSLGAVAVWVGFFLLRAALCKRRHDRVLHVITDRRIVSVCEAGVFRFETSSIILAHVSEVRSRVSGLPATLLRYGDVEFRTGDGDGGGRLDRVPRPHAVALQLQQACRVAPVEVARGRERPNPHRQTQKWRSRS